MCLTKGDEILLIVSYHHHFLFIWEDKETATDSQ